MSAERVLVQRGRYADSVTLMQVSRDVTEAAGVQAALVAMATELNRELLAGLGFAAPASDSANDLLVAIRADSEPALDAALNLTEQLLAAPRGRTSGLDTSLPPPRTSAAAARRGGPGLAIVSVPGQYAFVEAMDALEAGCDVLLFSDNVSVAQEIALKDAAAARGRLVMGPDCGTAVVGGVGLGFANVVAPGPLGIVAASGTGLQQLLCLLDHAGLGVRAALGVGGRDLSAAVAGRATEQALRLLDADPETSQLLLLSKPPDATVAARLRGLALATPIQFALLGPGQPDLTAAAESVLRACGIPVPAWPDWTTTNPGHLRGPYLRGLFCGGTLCDEAMLLAEAELGQLGSNIPLESGRRLADPRSLSGHCFIDFGADELTRGRAHPMIDPALRNQQLAAALADESTGVVLIDVELGYGAHPDPAAALEPVLGAAMCPVVISLIGSRADPQGFESTAERLHRAGASVFLSNAQATRYALDLLARRRPA